MRVGGKRVSEAAKECVKRSHNEDEAKSDPSHGGRGEEMPLLYILITIAFPSLLYPLKRGRRNSIDFSHFLLSCHPLLISSETLFVVCVHMGTTMVVNKKQSVDPLLSQREQRAVPSEASLFSSPSHEVRLCFGRTQCALFWGLGS